MPRAKNRQSQQEPDQGTALIARIISERELMTESDRRIADFVLNHQSAISAIAQADLARQCGVSPSTVSRFVRHLGERDFHAFQVSFTRSLIQMHSSPAMAGTGGDVSLGDLGGSLKTILANKVLELTSTVESLDRDDLRTVVKRIAKARMVEALGVGRTLPVAMDLAYKLERLGIPTSFDEYYEKSLSAALCLGPGDVLVTICRSGWSGTTQQVVHAAHDRGALCAIITSGKDSPLARSSDIVLLTMTVDEIPKGYTGNSRLTEMLIAEVIYTLVAAERKDSPTRMDEHNAYVLSKVNMP